MRILLWYIFIACVCVCVCVCRICSRILKKKKGGKTSVDGIFFGRIRPTVGFSPLPPAPGGERKTEDGYR